MRLKRYLIRRRFPELVGHELVGQAPLYVTELSMAKDTKIEYKEGHFYGQRIAVITLETGDVFTAYFNADVDLTMNHLAPGRPWKFKKEKPIRLGITFEDASGSLDVKPKSPKVALQLFAALEVVFKKMISETEHDFIMFTGDSQHQRLYDVLAKRISKMGSYVNKSQLGDVNQYILIKKGVE